MTRRVVIQEHILRGCVGLRVVEVDGPEVLDVVAVDYEGFDLLQVAESYAALRDLPVTRLVDRRQVVQP